MASFGTVRARRRRVGEVLQIELPDGTFAYGRVLRDAAVGFYSRRSTQPDRPPIGDRDYEFVVGVYDDAVKQWPVVGYDPSATADEDWPPPSVIVDPITGTRSIYERGEIRPPRENEVDLVEPAAVWDEPHLIERLSG